MTHKFCTGCKTDKEISEFYKNSKRPDGYQNYCKICCSSLMGSYYVRNRENILRKTNQYRRDNLEKYREYSREWRVRGGTSASGKPYKLFNTYNLSELEYNDLTRLQDGRCAVCGTRPPPNKTLHVDHDHDTGRVRGLLCQKCNTSIGLLGEDPDIVATLLIYLIVSTDV